MERHQFLFLSLAILFGIIHYGFTDGQRDHGEACSLRSQIANFFRETDSPEGCISAKGLVCANHKCVCADPSNVYEVVTPSTMDSIPSVSDISSSASKFLKKLVSGASSTTAAPATSVPTGGSGKCVGRAGSPCFTGNSTCVKHASCEGSPRLCKCQGIYSSDTGGHCSKTASLVQQVVKQTVG